MSASHVTYCLTAFRPPLGGIMRGYVVRVWEGESLLEEYTAGNSPLDSQAYVARGGVPKGTLRRYARQTAADMAAENGLTVAAVCVDEDESDD